MWCFVCCCSLRTHVSTIMSNRKSSTNTANTQSPLSEPFGQHSSSFSSLQGKKTRSFVASFQLIKCTICLVELIKKDLTKHDETICKSLIESSLQLANQSDFITLFGKENIFDSSFIFNRNILYTNSMLNISKGLWQTKTSMN